MKILLEELPHQEESLKAILENFTGIDNAANDSDVDYVYANPLIRGRYNEISNIDVKMETGTGKTYVYTRLMYEMHQQYGIFKFVIVVPSPAIKEGAKNFIQSDYAKQHFSQFYENVRIELNVINAGDFKSKSGRRNFPAQLLNFVEGSRQNSNTIEVLLINADMLRSKSMRNNDYDQTLIGGTTSPIEAIQDTRPVVIIDEPHRFPRDKANYQSIEAIKPQVIIRFGATFPEVTTGKGSNKITKKDYYRKKPQFDLNAIESFNNGLVKGIDIYYPNLTEEQAKNRYVVDSVKAKELVLKQNSKSWILHVGDNLAEVDSGFEGDIEYAGSKMLSNELELEKGMTLIPGTYRSTYQELIIKDAIDKHFEIEQANFLRANQRENNVPRIKTLSLFFIDSITSYRQDDGWLKATFERLLKEKLSRLVAEYEFKRLPREKEYLEFLRATQSSLASDNQNVHAGYFGEDRGSGDESIQAEVDDILKNKEKLLSFKDENGNWQTRRFLFSKWTLREGWDNPNVFVIAKLRTSGSDNSKIQEVGRGLRLPVDETGHRIQQDEWPTRLAFLIGYDEKDFAQKLIGEINSDAKLQLNEEKLTEDMIQLIVTKRKKVNPEFTDERLLGHLDNLGIINRKNEFKESIDIGGVQKSGFEWLVELYPELNTNRLREGKVIDTKKHSIKVRVKLRKENWEKVKELWQQFSNRYMLEFQRIPETISFMAEQIVGNHSLYEREVPMQMKESLHASDDNESVVLREQENEYQRIYLPGMAYGKFVKRINIATGIPIKEIHANLFKLMKSSLKGDARYLSELSLNNIIREFKKRFDEIFAQAYEYKKLDFQARTAIYNPEMDSFVDDINAEVIGVNIDEQAQEDNRYLYELPPMRYDSVTPERDLLRHGYNDKVTVFGKLPRRAIQVPKYTGGSTTPDFIYMIEKDNDSSVYVLVETKAENMRLEDQRIIDIQKKFFDTLKEHHIEFIEATSAQQVYSIIRKLSEE
ncbi:type III restriction-modification system endonuclease [Bacillus cereus group sp. Bc256]|uniref:type III restriction-modification system endonuclease n=1 Tax=Bacillus cereus group sp. Bc256 TaxID=3018102 RepID=UPI0022E906B7|nr:type III restriction-modification system endonuclease [Bacillus cereus group sp. Bc256]MDA2140294.1 type III restriction-modification system endonuclease [Bacillus cereus group sp. Bc256]